MPSMTKVVTIPGTDGVHATGLVHKTVGGTEHFYVTFDSHPMGQCHKECFGQFSDALVKRLLDFSLLNLKKEVSIIPPKLGKS